MTTRREQEVLESSDVILHKDHYSPEELAELLSMTVDHIRGAVHNGRLHAMVIDHRIISIRREDVLAWLESRAAPR
jgi:excisionase family DNA binding protein